MVRCKHVKGPNLSYLVVDLDSLISYLHGQPFLANPAGYLQNNFPVFVPTYLTLDHFILGASLFFGIGSTRCKCVAAAMAKIGCITVVQICRTHRPHPPAWSKSAPC